MKFLLLFAVVAIAASAIGQDLLDKVTGETTCQPGPFKIENRECHCASDYKHFTCPETDGGLVRIEGETRCQMGPFMMTKQDCHCASNGKQFTC